MTAERFAITPEGRDALANDDKLAAEREPDSPAVAWHRTAREDEGELIALLSNHRDDRDAHALGTLRRLVAELEAFRLVERARMGA